MSKMTLLIAVLVACSPDEPDPMRKGSCVDRVVPNLLGPGDVSYRECRWRSRVWVCMPEADVWACKPVTSAPTRAVPAAPAAPSPTTPTS